MLSLEKVCKIWGTFQGDVEKIIDSLEDGSDEKMDEKQKIDKLIGAEKQLIALLEKSFDQKKENNQ